MKASHSRIAQLVIASAFVLLTSAAFAQQGASVPARVTEAVDPANLVVLQGNTHPLARPESDRGAVSDSQAIRRVLLVLQRSPEQEAALRRLLDEQQTKGSPNFHHWLTPQEFGKTFGPADADIEAVTDWLTSEGFLVSRVGAGRTVIEFSGTAGQVRQAFHTEIHKFALNGEERFANTNDPQIPAALAPVVKGFASLNNFPRTPMIRRMGTFQRSKATGEVRPLFSLPQPNPTYYAVGPTDFATIYNVLPLWNAGTPIDGTGVTIAIVGESDINLQDVQDFRTMWGLKPLNNLPNFILNGPDPGILTTTGDETESDLDVEWSGAVAKGATIDFVVSESTESTAGIDLSAFYIIDDNLAAVMSESYGTCELFLGTGGNALYSTLWEQASAQGITVMVSSGDQGSAVCDAGYIAAQYGPMVSGNASTPFNIAVGGTDFNDNGTWSTYWNSTNTSSTNASALSYIPETTWNDTCTNTGSLTNCSSPDPGGRDMVGGSGGPSNCSTNTTTSTSVGTCIGGYAKPSWQTGTGVPADGKRDLPDVSLFAADGLNGSFYVICEEDANPSQGGSATSCDLNSPYTDFLGVGGTSASSPAFAGIMAMVNQKYGRQGNANYVLYNLAAQSGASCTSNSSAVSSSTCIFYDVNNAVTTGNSNNSVACVAGSPNCSNQTVSGYGALVSNLNGSGTTLAWTTTAGYDDATGLGSVNAANLVNHWTSASFKPSTTTISSLFPTTITHGQPINVSISVAATAPATGTPSGDVSLIAQVSNNGGTSPTTAVGAYTLTSGSVTSTSNLLPGGSYGVTAHYAGDGTFGASDSSPAITVTVNPESSLTTFRLFTFDFSGNLISNNATTAVYGSPYVIRADVTNSGGTVCASATTGLIVYPCPTGAVTVTDNGVVLPASDEEGAPAGYTPGVYNLNTNGYLEDFYIQFPVGSHPLAAKYAGDTSYATSTSAVDTITITQAATGTGVSAPTTATTGLNITLTASVTTSSLGFGPTGTVTFFNNGTPIGSPVTVTPTAYSTSTGVAASATASLPTSFSAAGTESITAQYNGDINYVASLSGAWPITVTNTPDFNFSANPTSGGTLTVTAGSIATSTLTIAPTNGFTGTVTFTCTGAPAGATCSAPSANVTSTSSVTSTLSITTTSVTSASNPPLAPEQRVPPSFRLHVGLPWLWVGLVALAMLISLGASRRRPAWLVLTTALLVVGIWAACGGGSSTPPPGAPAVGLSAGSLTFNAQGIGTTSTAQILTLTNTGNATLNVSSIALSGTNPGDFSQSSTCVGSGAPGATCAISVAFTPSANGTRSASLGITDNASDSPQTVSLSGTGATSTAKGTYPLTVTATSGSVVHPVTVTLTVQ